MGDFNLPSVDWASRVFPGSHEYLNVCNSIFDNGLHHIVDSPPIHNNILDLMIINDPLITCKIMKAIIKDDIIPHLWKHKLISKHQHGFLTKHSTPTQLLECVNDWYIGLSNNKQVDVAYLDFAKAFDSLVHKK